MTINKEMSEKFDGLAALIGHTPMLEISLLYKGEPRIVYAKAEYYNYSGSIKDRVACHILRQAYETGAIAEGMPIAEATSGNTGIAFAAIGAYLGNPVTIFMPDWMSKERINLIESFGATIRLVSKAEGGFTGSIALADRMGKPKAPSCRTNSPTLKIAPPTTRLPGKKSWLNWRLSAKDRKDSSPVLALAER